jgi:DNA-binding SARP family transcriptional activator
VTGVVLTLLGSPSASIPPHRLAPLGAKTIGLLAYLALEPGVHPRETLATLLWSDSGDDDARASLRQALRQLRHAFGDTVAADRQSVWLTTPVECDVVQFLDVARRDARAAAAFEVDRFLHGATFRQAPAFNEWAAATRERLIRLWIDALRDAARQAVGRSRWQEALQHAERWLRVDPLSEEAMGVIVEAEYCVRGRAAALRRFAGFRDCLRAEAAAEAGGELTELAARIERSPEAVPPRSAGDAPPELSFEADLVGRETHWRALTEAWQGASAHGERVALIEGEPGTGKTRLADEFASWVRARGGTTLRGDGYEPTGGPPFGTMAAALRGVIGAPGVAATDPEWLAEAARLLPDLRQQFPGLPRPPAAAADMERWRMFEGVAQLLIALAAERQVLLFVDDLQWCDPESCAMLQFLVRRLEAAPILLIATLTSGEVEPGSAPQRLAQTLALRPGTRLLTLQPLTEDEVWELIRHMGNIRAPAGGRRFARRLHAVSDGNPFQVIEITKMLFAEGLLGATPVSREWVLPADRASGGFSQVDVPRSVRDAIAMRVTRLPDELRQILTSIAVAARPVATDVLAHVHGTSRLRLAALADGLIERHLVIEQDTGFRMAHPLLGEAVRSGLSAARRSELHRALSLALEASALGGRGGGRAGDIAWHAERSGDLERARHFALVASDMAQAELAFEEALECLELARRVAPERGDEIDSRLETLSRLAGWTAVPRSAADTASHPISLDDMDLRLEGAATRSSC